MNFNLLDKHELAKRATAESRAYIANVLDLTGHGGAGTGSAAGTTAAAHADQGSSAKPQ